MNTKNNILIYLVARVLFIIIERIIIKKKYSFNIIFYNNPQK